MPFQNPRGSGGPDSPDWRLLRWGFSLSIFTMMIGLLIGRVITPSIIEQKSLRPLIYVKPPAPHSCLPAPVAASKPERACAH